MPAKEWPRVETLEPKKMHNVRLPVPLLTNLRVYADAMPGFSVTDLITIGSVLVAQLCSLDPARELMAELRPDTLLRNAMAFGNSPQAKQLVRALKDIASQRRAAERGLKMITSRTTGIAVAKRKRRPSAKKGAKS